jgi:alpha-glucosidase (family GH31 glycosyl hydrolase)
VGRDIFVAPGIEKRVTSRQVYLPGSGWYDFGSGDRLEGVREIVRAVELTTMPLVREGAMLPFGPVKQYVSEPVEAPLSVSVYPGQTAHSCSMKTTASPSTIAVVCGWAFR